MKSVMNQAMNLTENNEATVINAAQSAPAEQYVKPAIEVIEMEMEETILAGADSWGNGGRF